MNTLPSQAQVMAESRRAELVAAAEAVRRAAGAPRSRAPFWVGAAERTGLFLIRRGERLRQDAIRHRPAPIS